jgi:hypothetical protein
MEAEYGGCERARRGARVRLLAVRGSDGIAVLLFWDQAAVSDRDIVIEYRDRHQGLVYRLRPPRNRALDAFYHPNSYLDSALTSVVASSSTAAQE